MNCTTCNFYTSDMYCLQFGSFHSQNDYCWQHSDNVRESKKDTIYTELVVPSIVHASIIIQPHYTWEIQDPSKVEDYLACPRQYFYRYVLGWRPDAVSYHLEFGQAWHIAMEHLLLNGYSMPSVNEAFDKFSRHYHKNFPPEIQEQCGSKTSANALIGLAMYANTYNGERFQVLYTEVAGKITVSPTGRKMYFRMDSINRGDQNSPFYGIFSLEHKSGGGFTRQWIDKWVLLIQPGLYNHVLYSMFPGEEVFGVVINGYVPNKQGPRTKKEPAEFLRVPARRSPQMMEDWMETTNFWLDQIEADFNRLTSCSDSDVVMKCFSKNPISCTDYFGCAYHDFCMSWPNPLQYANEIPSGFKVERWDPSKTNDPEKGFNAKFEFEDGNIKKTEVADERQS